MGDSAGAHLAAMVALAGDVPELTTAYPDDPYAGTSTTMKAVIGVYGVYGSDRPVGARCGIAPGGQHR